MVTWEIFLLISILLFSVNGLFHRVLMREEDSDARAQTIIFLGLGGIFAFLIASSRGGFQIINNTSLLPNFLLLVLFSTIAPVLTFKAYKLIEASEISILLTSQRLWTVLAAFIFLQETFSINKILGTILILLGIAVTLWKGRKIKINSGLLFALLAAFLYGIGDVNGFYILRSFDAPSFEVYATLLPVFSLMLIHPSTIKKLKFYIQPKRAMNISLVTIFDTLATLSLYFAYQAGRNASQIAPLSATKTILTVILAAIILKEKGNLINKIVGAAIVVAGVIFII